MTERWQHIWVHFGKKYWASLTVCFCVLWLLFAHHITSLRQQLKADQKTVLAMAYAAQQIQILQQSAPLSSSTTSLGDTLEASLQQSPLKKNLLSFQQTTNNVAELRFQNVNFEELARWLNSLWANHGLRISQATVQASAIPGIVSAELVLDTSTSK